MRRYLVLAALALAACGEKGAAVTINPDIKRNQDEYLAAQLALKTVLSSCKTIDIVTPSSNDPGGYIIDCVNGDRYRIRSGETVARFEKTY